MMMIVIHGIRDKISDRDYGVRAMDPKHVDCGTYRLYYTLLPELWIHSPIWISKIDFIP